MGLVERFDRKLESTVGDAFARVFGGSIVPQEVEGMLRREAADGVRSTRGGRLLAPNDYVIKLSRNDYDKVSADPDLTADTFAKHLGGYIGEQGWQTYGDVVVRFEQSPHLHTGQVRAHGVVNPDATAAGEPEASSEPPAAPQPDRATAEPGVPPMSDNPSHRGGQEQGRPGPQPSDDYYDDRYGRSQDDQRGGGQDPRGGYAPDQGNNPPNPQQGESNYPPRQGGSRDQGGYSPSYDQRTQSSYGPPSGGYDPGYRQGGGYSGQQGGAQGQQSGYNEPPRGDYDYGRDRPTAQEYGRHDPRQGYPEQDYGRQDYGRPDYGRQDYGRQDYGRQDYGRQDYGRQDYGQPDYGRGYQDGPGGGYDYGQQPQQGGYGGYGQQGQQAEYRPGAATVTLQLDDGSGRTYQLREGANVVGRGQDAQFRLPDTGVSRRHLEIRWDGQVALLSDLNSTNGTTVNNAPVQEWQLADGDVIRLGHSEIVVRVH